MKRIDANRYYNTYHGHSECDLESVYEELCKYNEPIVFLCGDSSLDNKYWVLDERGKALNGYDKVLDPPVARFDVCYCMNREIVYRGLKLKVINAAVEATTLSDRKRNLLPQDRFVKGKISPKDYLIVSIGGNDVVLKPSFWTVVSLLSLVYWSSIESIENGTAYGIDHFVDLFKTQVETYIGKLTQHHLPKTIFVCMIYYPCESKRSPSWADTSLSLLRYNSHPKKNPGCYSSNVSLGNVESVYPRH
uniref:SGNH hydrolase-type esterase domain-containing protein n=1 Tax=Mucochytrium quahogii TaxID=96639 RepID=A0A7S2W6K1_9STRA|mmetsp:Transcript_793/g.1226  ORF Transcript_793/g.1226 Transcript_793/m.1226 type:complete len:248 (+) Transcript_793:1629-2372(+)